MSRADLANLRYARIWMGPPIRWLRVAGSAPWPISFRGDFIAERIELDGRPYELACVTPGEEALYEPMKEARRVD